MQRKRKPDQLFPHPPETLLVHDPVHPDERQEFFAELRRRHGFDVATESTPSPITNVTTRDDPEAIGKRPNTDVHTNRSPTDIRNMFGGAM